jgi:ABC-type transport system substrate-binding protein
LKRYVRSSKIAGGKSALSRQNLGFRRGDDPRDRELVARMKGKKLPAIGRVEISVMEETQSRWLAFERGETDMEYQLWDVAPTFMAEDGALKPAFAKRGIKLDRSVDPEITYTYFNMQEKIGDQPNPVGGFSKERIALRRAIAMAYKIDDQIRIIRKGQAVRALFPIPPGQYYPLFPGHFPPSLPVPPSDLDGLRRNVAAILGGGFAPIAG